MLRKTNSQKGFTIIEVVITIAIGAAVMALVLNAVAGARRSQRNNARAADVNAVAAGANQYIATRNALPTLLNQVVAANGIVDPDKFGHYELSSINPTSATDSKGPIANTGTQISPSLATPRGTTDLTADEVVLISKAGCNAAGNEYVSGGIREMAIVYLLEGQTTRSCLEI